MEMVQGATRAPIEGLDRSLLRQPTDADVEMLTAPRRGTLLVTLAPEQVPTGFIARLVDAGVCVSLGHSMATYAQTRAAIEEGLSGFTHLFNAMRPLSSREPGPIAAALEMQTCSIGARCRSCTLVQVDVDLERLLQERMRTTSFNDAIDDARERTRAIRRVPFEFRVPEGEIPLRRDVARFPNRLPVVHALEHCEEP